MHLNKRGSMCRKFKGRSGFGPIRKGTKNKTKKKYPSSIAKKISIHEVAGSI
jgi:hypothetical protein